MSTPNVKPAKGTRPERAWVSSLRQGGGGAPANLLVAARAAVKRATDAAKRHLLDAKLVADATGKPVGGAEYEVVAADDKTVVSGTTKHDGVIHHELKKPGAYTLRFLGFRPDANLASATEPAGTKKAASPPDDAATIDAHSDKPTVQVKTGDASCRILVKGLEGPFGPLKWSQTQGAVGDTVQLTAELREPVQGPVTFRIFEHDADGSHDDIDVELQAEVTEKQATAEWKVKYVDDRDDVDSADELSKKGYTLPEFFFEARTGEHSCRSGTGAEQLLKVTDFIDLVVLGEDDKPLPDLSYVLVLADGSEREGVLDGQGRLFQEQVVPGPYFIGFD